MPEPGELFLVHAKPCWRRLHAAARQYVTTSHDANDLVQETLMRAYRNFCPLQPKRSTGAWLFAILRNVALEWHRLASRRIRLIPIADAELTELLAANDSGAPAQLPTLTEGQFRDLLDEKLAAALDALGPVYREVIVLSVAADLNYREIAEVLDCPIGTVMSRMARARRELRERLASMAKTAVRQSGGRR